MINSQRCRDNYFTGMHAYVELVARLREKISKISEIRGKNTREIMCFSGLDSVTVIGNPVARAQRV